MFFLTNEGQTTVEAALLIPILFIVLLLLLQPGILFYDRMVMNHAAAEGCRLVATADEASGGSSERCEKLIKRRLGAIPQQDLFHIHDEECSYQIEIMKGDMFVSVAVKNKVKLIPLLDAAAILLGASEDGCISVEVEYSMHTQPNWISSSSIGDNPDQWVHLRD